MERTDVSSSLISFENYWIWASGFPSRFSFEAGSLFNKGSDCVVSMGPLSGSVSRLALYFFAIYTAVISLFLFTMVSFDVSCFCSSSWIRFLDLVS